MIYYRVNSVPPTFVGAQKTAHKEAHRLDTTYDALELSNDKNSILKLLNEFTQARPCASVPAAPVETASSAHRANTIIHKLTARELASVARALSRRIFELTGGYED